MAGNKRWSQNDIDTLKAEYGIVDVSALAKKLNRTVDAVHWKASKLDVKYDPDNVVSINHRLDSIEAKLSELVNTLQTSIHVNVKWSKKEMELLKKMYSEGNKLEEISASLKKPSHIVYNQLVNLGLKLLRKK